MRIEEYKPIDYRNWILGDEARKGVNIKRLGLFSKDELKIWDESVFYQDQRDDPGHGEITAYFALKLLDFLPGNRRIVVPAAILHDTGWYGYDLNEWKRLVYENKDNLILLENETLRRPHQNRGIVIAGKVLEKTGYFERNDISYGLEIADIIGDHDTRKLPTSESGRIVRTADLLWRVTYPHSLIYLNDKDDKETLQAVRNICLSDNLEVHLGEVGKSIARIEFVNMMYFKFPKQAPVLLKNEYTEELKHVVLYKK